jgi:hypothetical protein
MYLKVDLSIGLELTPESVEHIIRHYVGKMPTRAKHPVSHMIRSLLHESVDELLSGFNHEIESKEMVHQKGFQFDNEVVEDCFASLKESVVERIFGKPL